MTGWELLVWLQCQRDETLDRPVWLYAELGGGCELLPENIKLGKCWDDNDGDDGNLWMTE